MLSDLIKNNALFLFIEGAKMWKRLSFFVALPGVALCWVNAYVLGEHHHERPEFKPYAHLYIRSKVS